ncbi:MAG: M20/M25/M40 family metallo-hydrolase [Ignavibacteriaceae bacterium]|nr:M20/M25/M40 family metallo-hydrolase [Ignavibacteriaceae bacterium]
MHNKRLIEIFLQLAKINALSSNELPVAEYVMSFLSKLGFKPSRDNSQSITKSNTGNVICKIGDGGDFLLLSHMDTARPTLEVVPKILEDKIVSDGNTVLGVDNRAGIAVLLYSLEYAIENNLKLKNFTLSFTTCEETTLAGSTNLTISDDIKYAIIFDSSHRPGTFINSACGAKSFNIIINGKPSHSGIAPEKGINAITIAASAISKLTWGRLDSDTTANIGLINGGSAVNVIPEKVILDGEIRSFNMDKVEGISKQIKSAFEEEANKLGGDVTYLDLWDFKPFTVNQTEEVFTKVTEAISKVGLQPKAVISLGGSDANSLNARGIPSLNLGIGAQNPHGNDEFIYLDDLQKSFEIAIEIIKE